ncbi:hypothetical protein [Cohnella zeiphila]|uniref:Sporulation protein n=1 Tax=Cohnella zeiphila TaxID=2761120 RepID=A0A7X0STJ3_9BACL|nr:hypothetical protein [Cohnella zeiphila]MBB6735857.1 hypothetical protein [Cohnella zeiphila]
MHKNKRLWAGLTACSLAVALFQAGCASGNSNSSSIKSQSYANDGYLGTTNANPHIPGRHMALSYKNDAALIQEQIKNVRGVRGSRVNFNGTDAYVTILLTPGLNPTETPTVERQVASVLRFNFPRYTIHVSSSK